VAQRFTAAINGLFSATAFAAEGDCGARREFFTKDCNSIFVSGHRFSNAVSALNSDAPSGAVGRNPVTLSHFTRLIAGESPFRRFTVPKTSSTNPANWP
jgi:hypothetical protein